MKLLVRNSFSTQYTAQWNVHSHCCTRLERMASRKRIRIEDVLREIYLAFSSLWLSNRYPRSTIQGFGRPKSISPLQVVRPVTAVRTTLHESCPGHLGQENTSSEMCSVLQAWTAQRNTVFYGTCGSKPALCVVPCFEDYHSSADF